MRGVERVWMMERTDTTDIDTTDSRIGNELIACYGTAGGLRWIFDLGGLDVADRPFQFRNGPDGKVYPAGGAVAMNAQAAGWQGEGSTGSPWMHGRAGQVASIVLDVVPSQAYGEGAAGGVTLGAISHYGAAQWFSGGGSQ
jgi:hypothetical protein